MTASTKYPNLGPIPQAREALLQIAKELVEGDLGRWSASGRIQKVVNELMYRQPVVRKARASRPSPTAEVCEDIRRYARTNPDATQLDIANRFNTNPGRVSEALNGLR